MKLNLLARVSTAIVLYAIPIVVSAQLDYQCQIINADQQPLEGVMVSVDEQVETTDEKGIASFVLRAGAHTLFAQSIGYEAIQQPLTLTKSTRDTIILPVKIYQIEAVELSASWIRQDQPFTNQIMQAREIEERHVGQDVPFLLRWMPSMVVTSDAGTGIGYTGLRIRGSDPTRINVTIDGVPLNDSESQGVFWVDLPDLASSAEAIQVQRGVGTSTNGAGAFGGTINVKTKVHQAKPFAKLQASGGSFGTIRGNIQFGSGTIHQHFGLEGRVSSLTSNGYIDRSSADLQSLQLTGRYFSDNHSLKVSYYDGKEITYQAWNGVPQQFIQSEELQTYNTAGERRQGFHPDEVDNYRQRHLHAIYKQQISQGLLLNTTFHYTKGMGYFEQYRIHDDLSSYLIDPIRLGDSTLFSTDLIRRRWLDNDFYGVIFSLSQQQEGAVTWNFGGGYNRYVGDHFGEVIWARWAGLSEKDDEYYRNDAIKTDLNIYAQVQLPITQRLLAFADLQWRNVDYSFLGFNADLSPANQEVQHDFFNPKFGLTYRDRGMTYYYSISVAHREPNRNDYTESSSNSRPRPERLIDQELGLRHQSAKLGLDANFFHMAYRDQLTLTGRLNDVGEYARQNVAQSFRVGLETQIHWQPFERWLVNANAAWSINRITGFSESIDDWDLGRQEQIQLENVPLSFSPAMVSGGSISYQILNGEKTSLQLNSLHKYVSHQFLDNTGNEHSKLSAYYFSDLHILLHTKPSWASELSCKLMVRNIFDRQVITNGWIYRFRSPSYDPTPDDPHSALESGDTYNLKGLYPQAGINLLFGITLTF